MERVILFLTLTIFISSLSATAISSEKMTMHLDLNDIDGHSEFGISKTEPSVSSGSLSIDDIEEIYLEKEENRGDLKAEIVLYPYWNLVLSDDVDIEISGEPFRKRDNASKYSFDWKGTTSFSSNDKDIDSDTVIIGSDNDFADYSTKTIYSHRASCGMKSIGYAVLVLKTQNIAEYPAGKYESELIMKLTNK